MWYSVASWGVLVVMSVALARYYKPTLFENLLPEQPPQTTSEAKPTKQKNKRLKLEEEKGASTSASATEAPSKKRKLISALVGETARATTVQGDKAAVPGDEDGGMSNNDFAQQLAKAQAGTKLEKKQVPTKKDRRAAKSTLEPQQGFESPSLSAETSSTGGRDADDDTSPDGTPPIGTPSTARTSRAGDVSDMLEPAAAKPTTLRLTDVAPTQEKQATKHFEQVLTKKQRQRQQKQEENRRLREESERLHEAKKQQQLKAARTAAETSNQTKANAFTSSQNAWQKKPDITPPQPQPQQPPPLLDTFEAEEYKQNGAVTAAPLSNITNGAAHKQNANAVREEMGEQKTEGMAASSRKARPELSRGESWADEVNEEAQEEWEKNLVEEEQWEPVTSKKSKKKTKETDNSSETSVSARPLASSGVKTNGVQVQSMNRFSSMDRLLEDV